MINFLTYGEILLRISAAQNKRIAVSESFVIHAGGAEANVAAALAQWGINACLISAVPDNFLGQKAQNSLRGAGIDMRYVFPSGNKIGLYFTEEGSGFKPAEVIYDRANSVFSTHVLQPEMIRSAVKNIDIFHWSGITPAVSIQAYKNLHGILKVANNQNIISSDLNYRSKLWQWGMSASDVTPGLVELSNVLITTEEAARQMLALEVEDAPEEITPDYYHALSDILFRDYYNLNYIFIPVRRTVSANHNRITLFGKKRDGELCQSTLFDITEMVDRIGAGDAMSAGILYGLSNNWELQEIVNFGIASSAFKHAISGDFICAGVNEIMRIVKGSKSKIIR